MLDIRSEAEKALIIGVHEGMLKGNSWMIVGSVTPEVYERIEEYVGNASPAPIATAASVRAVGSKVFGTKRERK